MSRLQRKSMLGLWDNWLLVLAHEPSKVEISYFASVSKLLWNSMLCMMAWWRWCLECCVIGCASDEMLTGERSVCGVLMVLAGMLKHGKRDDLIEFGKLFCSFQSLWLYLTSFSQYIVCIVPLLCLELNCVHYNLTVEHFYCTMLMQLQFWRSKYEYIHSIVCNVRKWKKLLPIFQ